MKGKIVALFMTAAVALGSFGLCACGKEAVDVKDAYIDENGCLILIFTDDTQKNYGKIIEDTVFTYSEVKEGEEVVGYSVRGLFNTLTNDIVIPSSHNGKPVVSISSKAFLDCDYITSVVIPDSVEVIGELAFSHCEKLESVVMGEKVSTIDDYAFYQCYSLAEVTLPASVQRVGECAFSDCTSLKKITLNEGLGFIDDCAFSGCSSLESLKIPNSVTNIGWGLVAFGGGAGFGEGVASNNCLTELVISDSLTIIPQYAFSGCNIASASIGSKVEVIDYSAFYGCGLLESVVLPKSLKQIVSYAFYRCSALNTVFYQGTAEDWAKITVGKNGNDIVNATVYYYSKTQPAQGNFWHYVNGVPTKW